VAIIIILTATMMPFDLYAYAKAVSGNHPTILEEKPNLFRGEEVKNTKKVKDSFIAVGGWRRQGSIVIRGSPSEAERIKRLGFRPMKVMPLHFKEGVQTSENGLIRTDSSLKNSFELNQLTAGRGKT
jgi:hypothetical protein